MKKPFFQLEESLIFCTLLTAIPITLKKKVKTDWKRASTTMWPLQNEDAMVDLQLIPNCPFSVINQLLSSDKPLEIFLSATCSMAMHYPEEYMGIWRIMVIYLRNLLEGALFNSNFSFWKISNKQLLILYERHCRMLRKNLRTQLTAYKFWELPHAQSVPKWLINTSWENTDIFQWLWRNYFSLSLLKPNDPDMGVYLLFFTNTGSNCFAH